MAYRGGSLAPLFDRTPTRHALARMARTGGDKLVELTVRNTPIDTGNLRTSWYQLPMRVEFRGTHQAYRSGVATDVSYAPYVEAGTGKYGPRGQPYEIRPKTPGGVLAFRPRTGTFSSMMTPETGGMVFVKRVMHPGSPGAHMVASAAAYLDATFATALAEDLEHWKRDQEAQAYTAMGKRRPSL